MSKRDKIIMIAGLVILAVSLVFLTIVLVLGLSRNSQSVTSNDTPADEISKEARGTEAQRNNGRKRDASTIVQAVTNYVANTNNAIPDTQDVLYRNGEVNQDSKLGIYLDPLGSNIKNVYVYQLYKNEPIKDFSTTHLVGNVGDVSPSLDTITILPGQKCNSNVGTEIAAERQAAVVVQLETDGDKKEYYCLDAD